MYCKQAYDDAEDLEDHVQNECPGSVTDEEAETSQQGQRVRKKNKEEPICDVCGELYASFEDLHKHVTKSKRHEANVQAQNKTKVLSPEELEVQRLEDEVKKRQEEYDRTKKEYEEALKAPDGLSPPTSQTQIQPQIQAPAQPQVQAAPQYQTPAQISYVAAPHIPAPAYAAHPYTYPYQQPYPQTYPQPYPAYPVIPPHLPTHMNHMAHVSPQMPDQHIFQPYMFAPMAPMQPYGQMPFIPGQSAGVGSSSLPPTPLYSPSYEVHEPQYEQDLTHVLYGRQPHPQQYKSNQSSTVPNTRQGSPIIRQMHNEAGPASADINGTFANMALAKSGERTASSPRPSSRSSQPSGASKLNVQCRICSQTVEDPAATACGHVFCSSCITNALGEKGGSCPTCGKKLKGSGRGFRKLFVE